MTALNPQILGQAENAHRAILNRMTPRLSTVRTAPGTGRDR